MPVLDLYNLKEFNESLISKILEMYLQDGQEDINQLIKSLASKDKTIAKKRAHKLIGSSKTVGAINVASISTTIDSLLIEGKEISQELLNQLEDAFNEVKEHILKNELID